MAAKEENSSSEGKSTSVGLGMWATIKTIRAKFPRARDISTDALAKLLEPGSTNDNIVFLDCREEDEFTVSHLSGARRVDWQKDEPQQVLLGLPQDKPHTVVCYCSVGYRSSAVAEKILDYQEAQKKKGAPMPNLTVFNLEGSLFKWANEGRPLVDSAGKSTKFCHPYNAVWGKLLNKQLRRSDSTAV